MELNLCTVLNRFPCIYSTCTYIYEYRFFIYLLDFLNPKNI